MSIKNFLTKLLKFPFKGKAVDESPRSYPDGDSIDMTDEEIEAIIDSSIEAEMEEDESPSVDAEEILKSIPEEAKKLVLQEKIIKMKNGETILAQMLLNRINQPIITQHGTAQFVTLTCPVVIRTMYIPNLNNGTMNTHHVFEEWISNTKEPTFSIDITNIQTVASPLPDVINSYRLFTTKNRMYKLNPVLAEHVFELPYMDIPDNYNVEMSEVEDEEPDDGFNESAF